MPTPPAAAPPPFTRRDVFLCVAMYLAILGVFWYSPVVIAGDSRYTLLLTENLLHKGSFVLDDYGIPRNPPIHYGAAELDGKVYQIEIADGHFYYFFPPGSSILSAPFVLAQDAAGRSVIKNGAYYVPREEGNQHFIASALMAGLTVIFYLTARLFLPAGWSALVALGGALGTQVWSTASRSLWNHTWGVALLGLALLLIVAHETGRRRLPPVFLATLLSWAYFVRPTNSLFILGATLYLLLYHRHGLLLYVLTGAAWFAGFAVYSWAHFGRLLPSYFAAARLSTSTMAEALAGNLVSPSRGLLLFVPVVLFAVYLPLRFWRYCPHRRLLGLAAGVSACHYVTICGFIPWYGGGCYGPRYTTELVPWIVLAATLGLAAALRWRADEAARPSALAWRATLAAGGVLLGLSVFVNGRGATSNATRTWNQFPALVDRQPGRIWDWSYPQFLAGILPPPLPAAFPVAANGQRVFFGDEQGRPFLYDGWRGSEKDWCWSAEHRSVVIFAAGTPAPATLRLGFGAYVHPPQLARQRVTVRLNGQVLGEFSLDAARPAEHALPLPAGVLQARNFLSFELPDATKPISLGDGPDMRLLGISLAWMELNDDASPPPTPTPAPTPVP